MLRVFRFAPENRQHWFSDLSFKITVTVFCLGENKADFGLSVAPQNQRREVGVGHTSRFSSLLRREVCLARVFWSDLKLKKPDGPVWEIRWSSLVVDVNRPQPLSWSLHSPPGLYPAMLPPPPTSFPHQSSVHHWPKVHSSARSDPDCSLVDQQRIHPSSPLAHSAALGLLLLSGKPNHPVWGSEPSNFPVSESCCLAGGRRICNGRLLHSSLHGQNP
jgi:hypothetical protein